MPLLPLPYIDVTEGHKHRPLLTSLGLKQGYGEETKRKVYARGQGMHFYFLAASPFSLEVFSAVNTHVNGPFPFLPS